MQGFATVKVKRENKKGFSEFKKERHSSVSVDTLVISRSGVQ